MSEFDTPWKEALDRFLPLFLQFFFPDAYSDIDWSRGYEALDKELAQVVREAESQNRLADKLFKVWLKNGDERWVLIHVEVQAHREPIEQFGERIYDYNHRIFDRFRQPVASLIILADDDPNWRPSGYGYEIWGTRSILTFEPVKLLEFLSHQVELEQDENPFSLVVLAHLQSLTTRNDGEARQRGKVRLVKNLLDRGLKPDDIRQLFRVIDWLLELSDELSTGFWDEIQSYEEGKKMPVITSTEQLWLKQGREEGRQSTLVQMISRGLQRRFQAKGQAYIPVVENINDLNHLEAIMDALLEGRSLDEVKALMER